MYHNECITKPTAALLFTFTYLAPEGLVPMVGLESVCREFMTEKFSFAVPVEDILALFASGDVVSMDLLLSDVAEAAASIIGSP